MSPALSVCPRCGSQIPAGALDCPSCRALTFESQLKTLFFEARQAESEGRYSEAMAYLRQTLPLLPADSPKAAETVGKITQLGRRLDSPAGAEEPSSLVVQEHKPFFSGVFKRVGLIGLLLVLLSKIKFLLLGLAKLPTLLSMLAFFWVYIDQWGWKFALGLVLSIYVHEMGHVAALRRYGIQASAPLFIPFLGAIVRLKQKFVNRIEDSRVGLAGPWWGLGAALAAYGGYYFSREPIWGAIARTGAWINLFNLIPFWQLDGGRGFHSMTREQRWLAFAAVGGILFITREHLLLALLAFSMYQALKKDVAQEPDWIGFLYYTGLVFVFSWMCTMEMPGVPTR